MKINSLDFQDTNDIIDHNKNASSLTKAKTSNNIKENVLINEMTDENGSPTEQAYQVAVNKLNEFMAHTQRNSKFAYHKELDRYYVEVVDAQTQEVVKEIPPKELLDAYYEMQKVLGKMFDTQA